MKTYLVTASYMTYLRAFIDAENESEAEKIAQEMQGGFKEEGLGDWLIDSITEEVQHG
jgi:hypothetical protein